MKRFRTQRLKRCLARQSIFATTSGAVRRAALVERQAATSD